MDEFTVIALATATAPPYEGCRVIVAGAPFEATHKVVFGPANKEECEAWQATNCTPAPLKNFIVAALVAALPTRHEDCLLLPVDGAIPATHKRVFGPATEQECRSWINDKCTKPETLPSEIGNQAHDVSGDAGIFVVTSLAASPAGKYVQCQIHRYGDVITATHKIVFGPASRPDCSQWIDRNCGAAKEGGQYVHLYYVQYSVIAIVAVTFVLMLYFGLNRTAYASHDGARGLITFLVAVSTVGIATLAVLTAMLIRDFKERFDAAKEVLTILVGILGTIVGFYYGQAASSNSAAISLAEVAVPQTVTKAEPNEIRFKVKDGKAPYHYIITFTPDSVRPSAVAGDSSDGEVTVTFSAAALSAEVREVAYTIEVTDAGGKHHKESEKRIPVERNNNTTPTPTPPENARNGNTGN